MNYPVDALRDLPILEAEAALTVAAELLALVDAGARFALTENALLINPYEGRTYMQLLPDDPAKANYYIDVIYPALI